MTYLPIYIDSISVSSSSFKSPVAWLLAYNAQGGTNHLQNIQIYKHPRFIEEALKIESPFKVK